MCNSTLLVSALTILSSFLIPSVSITVFAINPTSFAKLSYPAVPEIFTPFAPFNLSITLFVSLCLTNILHVIELVPSYKSKNIIAFSFLISLESVFIIFPSKAIFLLSIIISFILSNSSFIVALLPYIRGLLSSSTTSCLLSLSFFVLSLSIFSGFLLFSFFSSLAINSIALICLIASSSILFSYSFCFSILSTFISSTYFTLKLFPYKFLSNLSKSLSIFLAYKKSEPLTSKVTIALFPSIEILLFFNIPIVVGNLLII